MGRVASAGAPVRVLIVDDQPRFHAIARELIDATPGFECVGCATCGEQGVDEVHRLHPDLVLMDVRMPGIGGVEAARRIVAARTPPVVVLITADEPSLPPPTGIASDIVQKNKLSPGLLRRLCDTKQAANPRSGRGNTGRNVDLD